jgi:hypothetical protein
MKATIKLIVLIIFLTSQQSCKTQKFTLTNHECCRNCLFKNYLKTELNEIDTNYDKSILFRINFCGSELCSKDLYNSMRKYVLNEKKKVLIVINYRDTVLTNILSNHPFIKIRIDQTEKYLKYGFQRPGHYAFIHNNITCPTQYTNITESFILWFEKQ